MRIVVDALGGDNAPTAVIAGAQQALASDPGLELALTGPAEVICPFADGYGERCSAHPTTEAIGMDEHPAEAVRAKKDSSIVVGMKLVADGQATGFFSAGSTGAVMTAATLHMGRIKGIARPMLTTMLPTKAGYVVFGDVGANADVKLEYLLQFALMGEAYAREVMGIAEPRVGLLNIGEEPTKGSEAAQQAYELLSTRLDSFAGNAEGTDILSGRFDVIVTDGFTGNIALKTIEGVSEMLFDELKLVMTATTGRKLAAQALKPGLQEMKRRLSSDAVGGAPLLGVRGACLIGHGSSSPEAIANGILATAGAARSGLTEAIAQALA